MGLSGPIGSCATAGWVSRDQALTNGRRLWAATPGPPGLDGPNNDKPKLTSNDRSDGRGAGQGCVRAAHNRRRRGAHAPQNSETVEMAFWESF